MLQNFTGFMTFVIIIIHKVVSQFVPVHSILTIGICLVYQARPFQVSPDDLCLLPTQNIRLGHLQLLSLFVSQARTRMASVNEYCPSLDPFFACGVWGIGKGRRAKKGLA